MIMVNIGALFNIVRVEMRGVEPLSEGQSIKTSTIIVGYFAVLHGCSLSLAKPTGQ